MQRYSEAAGTEGSVIEATDGEYILYSDHVEAMKRIAGDSGQQAEPVAWFEADESARGGDIRTLVRSLVHSTRWHWQSERPVTGNPVWPLYAAPAPASPAALTDEQITDLWNMAMGSVFTLQSRAIAFARALLAASPAAPAPAALTAKQREADSDLDIAGLRSAIRALTPHMQRWIGAVLDRMEADAPSALPADKEVEEARGKTWALFELRRLPAVTINEIDGEESDGTPKTWRRPYVSRRKVEELLDAIYADRAAMSATPPAA